jgi:hypothetical protein
MSWNFFDAWKIKRTNEKQFKCTEKEFSDQEKKCKKSLTFGKTAQKTLDSMTPYAETIN